MIWMSSVPTSPQPGPTTMFTGHTKESATSEPQIALNIFKRATKRDASSFPIFKKDLYYVTFQ